MARTIAAIKAEMTEAFMSNTMLQTKYGFAAGTSFENRFSRVSIENILLYIVAASIWTLEKLFDLHTTEVQNTIALMKPHTLRWYVQKAKSFLYGYSLIDGDSVYDTARLTDDQIAAAQIVSFAAVTEIGATLYMKVAKRKGNTPAPLATDERTAFVAYLHEIKDAGVRVDVISQEGDYLKIDLDIYYNPLILTANGQSKRDGTYPVNEAIKTYIEALPFDGEFRNNSLVDVLQTVEGVEMVSLNAAAHCEDGVNFLPVSAYCTPVAGYFKYDRDGISTATIKYIAYGTNAN